MQQKWCCGRRRCFVKDGFEVAAVRLVPVNDDKLVFVGIRS